MAALPWMQLYVADYLADTYHLNAAQHGAYLLLLMNYWQTGKCLPDSNDRLAIVARMSNDEWIANRPVIAEFFEINERGWTHHRVERDLVKVKGISDAGKKAGIASGLARKQKTSNDRSTVVSTIDQRFTNNTEQIQSKTDKENAWVEIWNSNCGKLQQVKKLTSALAKEIKLRSKEFTDEEFTQAVIACSKMPFTSGTNDRGWKATFPWILRGKTIKNDEPTLGSVLNGKYGELPKPKPVYVEVTGEQYWGDVPSVMQFFDKEIAQ